MLGNAHLLYNRVDLGNAQTPGAFQAVALVEGVAIFDLSNKYNRNIFLALGTHFRLHIKSLLR